MVQVITTPALAPPSNAADPFLLPMLRLKAIRLGNWQDSRPGPRACHVLHEFAVAHGDSVPGGHFPTPPVSNSFDPTLALPAVCHPTPADG